MFDFVTTPANWPRWHPSSVRVTGDAGDPQTVGERCTEEFVVAGRRGSAEWVVLACERPRRWTIEARPPRGGWARIEYALVEESNGGTLFTRTMTYGMPNLLLGVLDVLVLRRRIAGESATAVENLRRVLEAEV